MYDQAIKIGLTGTKQATYYTNKAFANFKLENYGLTIMEATEAIKFDNWYAKAYYWRGCANLLLTHYDDAIKDLKIVLKLCPNDSDAWTKLEETKKLKTQKLFAESIAQEEKKIELDPTTLPEEENYKGPKIQSIEELTPEWCVEAMKWMKDQQRLH